MIVLSGADLVLPARIVSPGTIVIEDGRISEIRSDVLAGSHQAPFGFHNHYIVPGFIDVHVHGVEGFDSLGGGNAVRTIAARLPRYGVTAFCPTTVACDPHALRLVLDEVRRLRETPERGSARVLPAHLESNFINPDARGAQPLECLRSPRAALNTGGRRGATEASPYDSGQRSAKPLAERNDFEAADILAEIERAAPDVGIVTVAPELDGGLDLVRWLAARGHFVSLGHSNATYEEGLAAIAAGARQATHLFNRMPPLNHRAPGLAGAILQTDEIAAELICDGHHVHPAVVRTAVGAKRPTRVLAITDATAVAGLPIGRRARLGGHAITASESVALLDDGTVAGSVWTMDRVFETLVGRMGFPLVDAVALCSTTAARELGLVGHGILAQGAAADLVVLDQRFRVVQTYIAGTLVYNRAADT
jgi:N-acetylglucosamine-6-phosphate deacetylase